MTLETTKPFKNFSTITLIGLLLSTLVVTSNAAFQSIPSTQARLRHASCHNMTSTNVNTNVFAPTRTNIGITTVAQGNSSLVPQSAAATATTPSQTSALTTRTTTTTITTMRRTDRREGSLIDSGTTTALAAADRRVVNSDGVASDPKPWGAIATLQFDNKEVQSASSMPTTSSSSLTTDATIGALPSYYTYGGSAMVSTSAENSDISTITATATSSNQPLTDTGTATALGASGRTVVVDTGTGVAAHPRPWGAIATMGPSSSGRRGGTSLASQSALFRSPRPPLPLADTGTTTALSALRRNVLGDNGIVANPRPWGAIGIMGAAGRLIASSVRARQSANPLPRPRLRSGRLPLPQTTTALRMNKGKHQHQKQHRGNNNEDNANIKALKELLEEAIEVHSEYSADSLTTQSVRSQVQILVRDISKALYSIEESDKQDRAETEAHKDDDSKRVQLAQALDTALKDYMEAMSTNDPSAPEKKQRMEDLAAQYKGFASESQSAKEAHAAKLLLDSELLKSFRKRLLEMKRQLPSQQGAEVTEVRAELPVDAFSLQKEGMPRLLFESNTAPDEEELRDILSEANRLYSWYGSDWNPSLQADVQGMIDEIGHFLYCSVIPEGPAAGEATMTVDGNKAMAFFRERLQYLESNVQKKFTQPVTGAAQEPTTNRQTGPPPRQVAAGNVQPRRAAAPTSRSTSQSAVPQPRTAASSASVPPPPPARRQQVVAADNLSQMENKPPPQRQVPKSPQLPPQQQQPQRKQVSVFAEPWAAQQEMQQKKVVEWRAAQASPKAKNFVESGTQQAFSPQTTPPPSKPAPKPPAPTKSKNYQVNPLLEDKGPSQPKAFAPGQAQSQQQPPKRQIPLQSDPKFVGYDTGIGRNRFGY